MNLIKANSIIVSTAFLVLVTLLCALSLNAHAAIEIHQFTNDTERERYQSLIDEMRCPKCQNQNLAGSDSPIAEDLRKEIYHQIKEGKSDKEIVDYMVARYGEFILYKPRLTATTALLWVTPVGLLVIGALVLTLIVRHRRKGVLEQLGGLTQEQQNRLDALLKQNPESSPELTSDDQESDEKHKS